MTGEVAGVRRDLGEVRETVADKGPPVWLTTLALVLGSVASALIIWKVWRNAK